MRRNILHFTGALVFLLLHTGYVIPQTTEFTYQGSITSAGTPANGSHDFEFLLYDAPAAGNQVGGRVVISVGEFP